MAGLINTDNFPSTEKLLEAVSAEFASGSELTTLTSGSKVVGAILSPKAAHKALATKVAEQWLAHPEILDDLAASLDEEPDEWND